MLLDDCTTSIFVAKLSYTDSNYERIHCYCIMSFESLVSLQMSVVSLQMSLVSLQVVSLIEVGFEN